MPGGLKVPCLRFPCVSSQPSIGDLCCTQIIKHLINRKPPHCVSTCFYWIVVSRSYRTFASIFIKVSNINSRFVCSSNCNLFLSTCWLCRCDKNFWAQLGMSASTLHWTSLIMVNKCFEMLNLQTQSAASWNSHLRYLVAKRIKTQTCILLTDSFSTLYRLLHFITLSTECRVRVEPWASNSAENGPVRACLDHQYHVLLCFFTVANGYSKYFAPKSLASASACWRDMLRRKIKSLFVPTTYTFWWIWINQTFSFTAMVSHERNGLVAAGDCTSQIQNADYCTHVHFLSRKHIHIRV